LRFHSKLPSPLKRKERSQLELAVPFLLRRKRFRTSRVPVKGNYPSYLRRKIARLAHQFGIKRGSGPYRRGICRFSPRKIIVSWQWAERERMPETGWWWTQVRANRSPGSNSLLTGKNTGNSTSWRCQLGDNSTPLSDLARGNELSGPIGTGNYQGMNRESKFPVSSVCHRTQALILYGFLGRASRPDDIVHAQAFREHAHRNRTCGGHLPVSGEVYGRRTTRGRQAGLARPRW